MFTWAVLMVALAAFWFPVNEYVLIFHIYNFGFFLFFVHLCNLDQTTVDIRITLDQTKKWLLQ